jgi:hypothetical protein
MILEGELAGHRCAARKSLPCVPVLYKLIVEVYKIDQTFRNDWQGSMGMSEHEIASVDLAQVNPIRATDRSSKKGCVILLPLRIVCSGRKYIFPGRILLLS